VYGGASALRAVRGLVQAARPFSVLVLAAPVRPLLSLLRQLHFDH
jgi:hypothetical protein